MSKPKLNNSDVLDTEQPLVTDNKDDPIEEITIEQLPEHILQKIINYLPKKDILTLTLVNKTLNGFISNNTCIMKNFVMVFPEIEALRKNEYNFPSIRKYSNWIFKSFFVKDDIATAAKFLERYGSHVKQITVDFMIMPGYLSDQNPYIDEQANFDMIITVLKICNNVEVLSIQGFPTKEFHCEVNSLPMLLTLPRLKHLTLIFTAEFVFDLFKNCHLESFVYYTYSESFGTPDFNRFCLQNFLKNQPYLEHLDFYISWFRTKIEHGVVSLLLDLNFKLKSLAVQCTSCLKSQGNSWEFINAQKDTLQKLETCSCLLYLFNGFPHVRHLKFNFDYNLENPFSNLLMNSVKILTITRYCYHKTKRILTSFAQTFPNVQEIKLENFTIRFDVLQELPGVSKLSLTHCRLVHVSTLTKLNSLEIRQCDIENQTFDWDKNQLEELIIEGGHHDWIENFLNHHDTNLKYLRLIGQKYTMQLNPELHAIINNNIHKIKRVSVDEYNPSGVIDEAPMKELNDSEYETSDSESNDSDANVGDDEN